MRSARLFALFTFLVTAGSFATVFRPLTDRELVDRSDAIVIGTVTGSSARVGPGGYIYTDYQLAIDDVLKGTIQRGQSVTISEVGGMLDGRVTFIEASATYQNGERVLTFLRQRPDGTWFTSAMTRGRFSFARNVAGEPVLVRDLAGEMPNEPVRLRDRFLSFIRDAAKGTTTSSSYVSATPETSFRKFVPVTNGNAQAYALRASGLPVRWPCPVNPSPCSAITPFFQNRTPTGAEGSAINQGLAQWNNDPNSNVAASNGGLLVGAGGPNPNDTKNVIYFDQTSLPASGFCDTGIACTLGAGGFTHTFDGDTWVSINDADILLLTSVNANQTVITHEIGHALGFRHSNQGTPSTTNAVMNSSVTIGTLTTYDRNAVDSLYGNGPACQPVTGVSINGGNRSIPAGTTTNLLAIPVPSDPGGANGYSYQWFIGKTGDTSRPDNSSTSASYTTPPINQPTDFWVRVRNVCTTANVDAQSVQLTPSTQTCDKPVINTQPQSQSVGSGTTASLSVAVSGTSPFTYEWYQGTTGDISNFVASTPSITTPPITKQTTFWVRVRNACGFVDSTTATISVIGQCTPPAFIIEPKSRAISSPRAVALVAAGSGDSLNYQWFRGTSPNPTNPITGLEASDSRFVRQLYVDLLGRDPDGATTGALVGLLTGGASSQSVAFQLLGSIEYRSELISSYFRDFLRRPADASTITFFLPLLGTSLTDEDVAASFLGSTEYYTIIAGGTHASFLAQLFNDVLGRSPSPAEILPYIEQLTNGTPRSDVALQVLKSAEGRSKLVQSFFDVFLRRSPTPTELSTFSGALSNQTDEQVMSSILGGNEYRAWGSVAITDQIQSATSFWVRVSNSCGGVDSRTATIAVATDCTTSAPTIVSQPQNVNTITGVPALVGVGVSGAGPFGFQWYEGNRGDTSRPISGGTKAQLQLISASVGTRTVWVHVTNVCNRSIDSNSATITVACGTPAPKIFADTSVRSGLPHKVSWEGDNSIYSSFELQVAQKSDFSEAQTQTLPAVQLPAGQLNEKSFTDTVTGDLRFYYRVRGKVLCNGAFSPFSDRATTLVTAPQPPTTSNIVINIGGNTTVGIVSQDLFIPGFGSSGKSGLATTDTFTVTSDRDFVTVVPSSGPLPPEGTTVKVNIDSSKLIIGSTQANLVIIATQGQGKTALASRTTSTSVSASKTTTATPTAKDTNVPPDSLIVLAVGHGIGGSGPFQSDVRVTNTTTAQRQYQLSFTPAATDGTTTGRQTTLTIDPGETKALDDIVSTWFAGGGPGENLGTLEVRPLAVNNSVPTTAPSSKATVSSRTFFVRADGATFGQFIPAIPVAQFLAKSNNLKLSIQQIQQNAASRTNIGIVEGSGQPANVEMRLFDTNNNQIAATSVQLRGFEFQQRSLSDFFGAITTNEARLEVKVLSDAGKVSAYASVVENRTTDPTLIFPKYANLVSANRYVVPGVANTLGANNSNFHTDMRVYNAATTATPVTMTFSGPVTAPPFNFTLQPGEVRSFNDVVKSVFNLNGAGGAVVATTSTNSSLVFTARTYSLNPDGGTFGQFIPGVTASEGVGLNERTLQVTQLEQSPAFRSNAGIVEVSGQATTAMTCGNKPVQATACARLTMINPDAKTVPTVDVPLGPNQFQQLGNIFAQVGFPTVYNGRVSVQVVAGAGRVSAYGSVIDNRSNDPTFVPAQ